MVEICKLCHFQKPLVDGHIMPNFAVRASRKQTFATQFISHAPDQAFAQQAHRRRLMCADCDNTVIGGYEDKFCKEIWQPFLNQTTAAISYDKWLLQFAASLAWRVSLVALDDGLIRSVKAKRMLQEACSTWRLFLANKSNQPGNYQHHIHLYDEQEIDRQIAALKMQYDLQLKQGIYAWFLGTLDFSVLMNTSSKGKKNEIAIFGKFANGVLLTYVNPPSQNRPQIRMPGSFDLRNQPIDAELFGSCVGWAVKTGEYLRATKSASDLERYEARLREEAKKSNPGDQRFSALKKDQSLPPQS